MIIGCSDTQKEYGWRTEKMVLGVFYSTLENIIENAQNSFDIEVIF
jgi:hypothetical protein